MTLMLEEIELIVFDICARYDLFGKDILRNSDVYVKDIVTDLLQANIRVCDFIDVAMKHKYINSVDTGYIFNMYFVVQGEQYRAENNIK